MKAIKPTILCFEHTSSRYFWKQPCLFHYEYAINNENRPFLIWVNIATFIPVHDDTVQAIRNITFANSHELFPSLSKITNFVWISCTKFTCEFAYEFVYEFVREFAKTKEKIRARISEIRALILKKESHLCTNLNKPTRLHQDRNSKTSYFDNFMVSFWKVNLSRCLCIWSFLCDPSMIW